MRGWGEGAPFPAFNGETQEQVLAACSCAEPLVVGLDVDESDCLAERIAAECLDSPSAVCAIETAILDCQARLRGVSIRELLGGAEEELVTDITITTGTVDEAQHDARAFAAFTTRAPTEPVPWHGQAQSFRVRLPPLGAVVLALER